MPRRGLAVSKLQNITSQFIPLRNVARAPEPRVVPARVRRLVHPRRAAQRVVVLAVDGVNEGAASQRSLVRRAAGAPPVQKSKFRAHAIDVASG